jgi:hypothetical protein
MGAAIIEIAIRAAKSRDLGFTFVFLRLLQQSINDAIVQRTITVHSVCDFRSRLFAASTQSSFMDRNGFNTWLLLVSITFRSDSVAAGQTGRPCITDVPARA